MYDDIGQNPDIYVPTIYGDAPESLVQKLKPTFDKLDALFDMNIIGKAVSYRMAEMMRNRLSTGTRPDGTSGMPYGTTTERPLGKNTGISLSIHAEVANRGYGSRTTDESGGRTQAKSEWIIKGVEVSRNQMRRVMRGVPFRVSLVDLQKETRKISIKIIKGEPLDFPQPPASGGVSGHHKRHRNSEFERRRKRLYLSVHGTKAFQSEVKSVYNDNRHMSLRDAMRQARRNLNRERRH